MIDRIAPVDPDEPAVRSPELRRLIDDARHQPVPHLNVSSTAIFRGWQQRRARQLRQIIVGGSLAVAAVVLLVVFDPRTIPTTGAITNDRTAYIGSDADPQTTTSATITPPAAAEPILASEVRVVARGGSSEPRVLSRWGIRLDTGSYEVELPQGALGGPLAIVVPGGTIELEVGLVLIVLTGGSPEMSLVHGRGTWVDEQGDRIPMVVVDRGGGGRADLPSAATLARRAEALIEKGDRNAAIDVLTTLVERHPRSSATRAALLDLGSLLKAAGRTSEAACAYQLYLERWPYGQVASEVELAATRLGTVTCRDLRPR